MTDEQLRQAIEDLNHAKAEKEEYEENSSRHRDNARP
jgi:hypothetical protein